MSAVSSTVQPASSAARTVRSDPCLSRCEAEYAQLIGMQPRPMAATRTAPVPIVLYRTEPFLPQCPPPPAPSNVTGGPDSVAARGVQGRRA
ncbi:hypothetical protein GCM10009757_32000 [Streptomyces cheonanensis]|uniref:Uncharacterized protein n=1 Tax=Streptomyces cheonanensis TaxID=312720 RepID=A0ABN2V8J5_9ACTN